MILLWGLADDDPLALVRRELERRGAPHAFVDHAQSLDFDVDVRFGRAVRGTLKPPCGAPIFLEQVGAAYLRPHDFRRFPALAGERAGSAAWRHATAFDDILLGWSETTRALVLNRPSAMASNSSKPFQCRLIRAAGFRTPRTLLTTDPVAARALAANGTPLVYKSISGVRSIVRRLTPARRRGLADVAWCPTQFQEWIEGTDYRVHVVGARLFACRIVSAADDYRYDVAQMAPADLPEDVALRCLRVSRRLELPLAGIDLRRTPDGEWFCFEVNPSPAYSCFEAAAGGRISAAIADLLIEAGRARGAKRRAVRSPAAIAGQSAHP